MSDTRPGEHARIKAIAGDDPRWTEALVSIALLLERSEKSAEWMEKHDASDERRFAALESRVTGVTSNVGELETDRARVMSVRDAAMVLAKFFGVLIAAGWAVWLTFFRGQP